MGSGIWIGGIDCDVSSPASVQRLADGAASQMGSIDVWINNAGFSGSFQVFIPCSVFLDMNPPELMSFVYVECFIGTCARLDKCPSCN